MKILRYKTAVDLFKVRWPDRVADGGVQLVDDIRVDFRKRDRRTDFVQPGLSTRNRRRRRRRRPPGKGLRRSRRERQVGHVSRCSLLVEVPKLKWQNYYRKWKDAFEAQSSQASSCSGTISGQCCTDLVDPAGTNAQFGATWDQQEGDPFSRPIVSYLYYPLSEVDPH